MKYNFDYLPEIWEDDMGLSADGGPRKKQRLHHDPLRYGYDTKEERRRLRRQSKKKGGGDV